MLNIDELKKLYDEYLETLNDIVNEESYGTESDFAAWYIPDFIEFIKKKNA